MKKVKIGPTDRNHIAKIDAFISEAERNSRRVITNDEFVNGASSGASQDQKQNSVQIAQD